MTDAPNPAPTAEGDASRADRLELENVLARAMYPKQRFRRASASKRARRRIWETANQIEAMFDARSISSEVSDDA